MADFVMIISIRKSKLYDLMMSRSNCGVINVMCYSFLRFKFGEIKAIENEGSAEERAMGPKIDFKM